MCAVQNDVGILKQVQNDVVYVIGNNAKRHNEVEDFWKPSWFFFLWFGFFLFECAKQKERNEQGKDAGMRLIDAEINSARRGDRFWNKFKMTGFL